MKTKKKKSEQFVFCLEVALGDVNSTYPEHELINAHISPGKTYGVHVTLRGGGKTGLTKVEYDVDPGTGNMKRNELLK